MPEFLAKYQITATDFGLFASLYYLGYAGMQIPVAILLDRFGPRLILSLSALLCGVACLLITQFSAWPVALFSRFLIGAGSVVGFLGASKIISSWFPPEKYGRLVGLTFSFGLLGAVYGGRPVSILIENMGWERVLFMLGLVAIAIGILVFALLKNKQEVQTTKTPVLSALKFVFSKPSLLMLAFSNLLMVGALEGFADVWGVPYLMAARGLSKPEAAGIVSFIFVGMLFGGPILAYIAEKIKSNHKVIFAAGVLMSVMLSYFLFFNNTLSPFSMKLLMLSIGVLCCYQVLVFAIGASIVPNHLLSITVAFLNCINMIGGSFFHSAIGTLMDVFGNMTLINGVPSYDVQAYAFTLLLIPICSLIGAFGMLWSKGITVKSMQEASVQCA